MTAPDDLIAPLLLAAAAGAPASWPLRAASLPVRALAAVALVALAVLAAVQLGLPAAPDRDLVARLVGALLVLFLATVVAGGAIAWLLSRLKIEPTKASGPPGTGRIIGMLERLLLACVFPIGGAEAVALVFAAKQLARIPAIQQAEDDGATAEYILVGSLLSVIFGLAGGVGLEAVLRT